MNIELVCYGIIAPISLISQLILIYGYVRVKKMREYPEILVFWQCVAQSVMDLHWITGVPQIHSLISSVSCQIFGAVSAYFYLINWDYILCLSIEILIKVKDPFNSNYKNRVLIYHICCHFSSLLVLIMLCSVDNNNGSSSMMTCFIEHGSPYTLIMLIPELVHTPICTICCTYTLWVSRGSKHANYTRYHIYVVFVFILSFVPAGLADSLGFTGFHVGKMEYLGYVSGR